MEHSENKNKKLRNCDSKEKQRSSIFFSKALRADSNISRTRNEGILIHFDSLVSHRALEEAGPAPPSDNVFFTVVSQLR